MSTAHYAGRILEAWSVPESGRFEAELESVRLSCNRETAASEVEQEHQELLVTVVEHLRRTVSRTAAPLCFETSLALLRHLRSRGGVKD